MAPLAAVGKMRAGHRIWINQSPRHPRIRASAGTRLCRDGEYRRIGKLGGFQGAQMNTDAASRLTEWLS